MKPCQIQLLVGPDFVRVLCRLCRLRDVRNRLLRWTVRHENPAVRLHRDLKVRVLRGYFAKYGLPLIDMLRRERGFFPENDRFVLFHADDGMLKAGRRIDLHRHIPAADRHVHTGVLRRVLYDTDFLIGHEILRERFLLKRLQPREIRLIVRKDTGHQLHIRPVGIREIAVPRLPEVTAPPGPLLFPGTYMMVRNVQNAGLPLIVISPDKIKGGASRHEGCGNRDIPVSGNVHSLAVVVLVINTGRNRESGHVPLPVIHDSRDVGRHDGLRMVVHGNGRIRPPEKGLRQRRPVVQLPLDFDIGDTGQQRYSADALCPVDAVRVVEQDADRSVRVLRSDIVHRHKGGGAVVLRPVKFNAA